MTAPGRGEFPQLFGRDPSVFWACFAVWTLSNMDQALFGYAIPGILTEFGLPLSFVGLIITVSFVIGALFVGIAGVAADRYGRGVTIGVLLATSAVAVAAQGLAGSVLSLTLFRALGFGLSGGLAPTTTALVVENSTSRLRGVTTGLLQCGYPLGWLLASLLAAPLLEHHGWRAICFLALGVVPFALPLVIVLRRSGVAGSAVATHAGDAVPKGSARLLLNREYRRRSFAIALMYFSFGGAYAGSAFFFPTFFTQERGYSEAAATTLVGASNGIAIFGYLAAALIGEFVLTRRRVFAIWCVGGAAALLGLLWLSHGPTQDLFWYSLTAIFFFGTQAVSIVLVAELFPTPIRTTAIALTASAPLSLGFAVFPLVVPIAVASWGWAAGLSIVVVPLLLISVLCALALPDRRSGDALA